MWYVVPPMRGIQDLDAAGKLDEHPDTTKRGCKIMWTREQVRFGWSDPENGGGDRRHPGH